MYIWWKIQTQPVSPKHIYYNKKREKKVLSKAKSICRAALESHNAGELSLSGATHVWHSKIQSTQGKPWD